MGDFHNSETKHNLSDAAVIDAVLVWHVLN